MENLFNKSVDIIPWWLRDRIRKIPFLAWLQKVVFMYFISDQDFIYRISAGPAKGLVLPIKLPDDKLIWTGTWEKDIAEVIAQNVRQGTVCFDIGSHRGFMAGIMALAGAKRVYCFEPNPVNLENLAKLCDLNQDLNISVLDYAVSDQDGESEFSIMPESSMGKLSKSTFQKQADKETSIRVQVRSLDSLLEKGIVEAPGFIKIDVEGAEYAVLQGARKLIEKYWPSMVIEVHLFSLAHECKRFLEDYGYETRIIQKGVDLQNEQTFSVCHLLARKP